MKTDRRNFIKSGMLLGAGMAFPYSILPSVAAQPVKQYAENELLSLSSSLLQTWGKGLISLQIKDSQILGQVGGIMCPACSRVHGRASDAIYPFMHLAEMTKDDQYLKAAIQSFEWMEKMVSFPNGSWVNDVNISLWDKTTAFGAIALAEALIHHGHLLDSKTYTLWKNRLAKAAEFLFKTFNITFANINYPATCSYALSLIGDFLENQQYKDRGRELAQQCKPYFTEHNNFLYGEGHPQNSKSKKGFYPIDLGYNVEESLPSLVMYGKYTQDQELLDILTKSLQTHAEFMLPDGGWDNSWGTRNYKWTYWGSRTTDGGQAAYAMMADRDPVFYQVALQNTKLLESCTHNNLLYGGIHYLEHDLLPCSHHTFCHTKALATLLQHAPAIEQLTLPEKISLPREQEYGLKEFKDIDTYLVSKNKWRGTVTGYDREFDVPLKIAGHATGGALSLLWHQDLGPVLTASMNRYQMWEVSNMQMDKDELSMPLTPRFEVLVDGEKFMNIADLEATIQSSVNDQEIALNTKSRLVNETQKTIANQPISCSVDYRFVGDQVVIRAAHNGTQQNHVVKFILPVVSAKSEEVTVVSANKIQIKKEKGTLVIESDTPIKVIQHAKERIFNFVPGMQAIPLELVNSSMEIKIYVI